LLFIYIILIDIFQEQGSDMKGDTTDMATTSSNGSNYDGDGGDGTMMMTSSITMTTHNFFQNKTEPPFTLNNFFTTP
jgi:hypothetical protein